MANLTNSAKLINEMQKKVDSSSLAAVATSGAYGDLTGKPGNASSTTAGLIKLGSNTVQTDTANDPSSTANRTYPVQVDADGKAVVNVPWSDTTTGSATSISAGTIKLGSDTVQSISAEAVSSTSNRSYALQVNASGQGVVNVPWENTTYSEVTKSDMDTGTDTTAGIVAAKSIADYVSGMIGDVYKYKGTKSTYEDLPTSGRKNGDVWNIETAHTTDPKFPAGSNVAWTGSSWDILGGVFDLSSYVDLSSNQTIGGTKTFSTSPIVPSKTSDATNTGTAIATEAQVYSVAQTAAGKQDALDSQTAYTSKGSATKVPQITTNSLGQVTGITEVTITHPSQVDDTAYANTWDGVTDKAPSQNAVYDKISTMDTTISGKITAPETGSTGQVLKKTATGVEWANESGSVTSVNGQTGDVVVNDVKKGSTAPSNPTEGMTWYDTTNDTLKTYNGSSWDEAGGGIGSSNNTYDNVIYLSQADYEALTTKDPNTLYSTPDDDEGGNYDESNGLVYLGIKDYDSLFSLQTGLYKILNSISSEDELGLQSGNTWTDVVSNQQSMNMISHSWSVMNVVANSDKALDGILNNNTALGELANSRNAAQVMAYTPISYEKILSDSNACSIVLGNQVSADAFFENKNVRDFIISNDSVLTTLASSGNALSSAILYDDILFAISNSSSAMIAIADSSSSINAIKNNELLVNKLTTNSNYLDEVSDSDFGILLGNENSLNIILANTLSKTRYASSDTDTVVLPAILSYID